MDPKKIIKKYIMPGFLVRGGAIVLAAVLAVSLVMGLLALTAKTPRPCGVLSRRDPHRHHGIHRCGGRQQLAVPV